MSALYQYNGPPSKTHSQAVKILNELVQRRDELSNKFKQLQTGTPVAPCGHSVAFVDDMREISLLVEKAVEQIRGVEELIAAFGINDLQLLDEITKLAASVNIKVD